MKRVLTTVAGLVLFCASLGATSNTTAYADNGNSDAAHACQHGGFASLIGVDGATALLFTRTGQCV